MKNLAKNKVVNLSLMGLGTTLVGIPAMIVTGLIVVIGAYVLYKIAIQPVTNLKIG